MSKSIEHSTKFHMARRISKTVAPEFRILARSDFSRQESCLDLEEKTIEVSESAPPFEAVGAILFHLGHLRLREDKRFANHFGSFTTQSEKELIKKLVREGVMADHLAVEWALEVFLNNFGVSPERAKAILTSQMWSEVDWEAYYAEQVETGTTK